MDYREIPEDKILKFPATPGFKGWKDYFTEESVAHPAKMNLNLLRWILKTCTSEGDVVLDPMAGTGSTIILASLLGRHGIAVEYEPRFCEMIRENIKRTEPQSTLTTKGRMICIQGDARELSKLLEESDAIITSPPYSQSMGKGGGGALRINLRDDWWGVGSGQYSEDKGNIGNLKHGDIEAIITSPPYEGSRAPRGRDSTKEQIESRLRKAGYSEEYIKRYFTGKPSDDKMKGLGMADTYKVDAVVSSPPYGNRLSDEAVQDGDEARMSYRQAMDSIVTSPPYEAGPFNHAGGHGGAYAGGIAERDPKLKPLVMEEDNIGNLKGETYLEAMLKVFRECWKVLKQSGKLILVTKNFIRDKNVVRLDSDTIKLCEAAGFTLMDRWYFKLPTMSFWRILYRRKYPDTPRIDYEDVLVFTKEGDIQGRKVKG